MRDMRALLLQFGAMLMLVLFAILEGRAVSRAQEDYVLRHAEVCGPRTSALCHYSQPFVVLESTVDASGQRHARLTSGIAGSVMGGGCPRRACSPELIAADSSAQAQYLWRGRRLTEDSFNDPQLPTGDFHAPDGTVLRTQLSPSLQSEHSAELGLVPGLLCLALLFASRGHRPYTRSRTDRLASTHGKGWRL
jgi:hypothetical protein